MNDAVRLVLLEDSDIDAEMLETVLRRGIPAHVLRRARNRAEFAEAMEAGGFDLVLADYSLPDFDGLNALAVLREKRPDVPFIFVSGVLGEEFAIEALKQGATDYVLKRSLARLPAAVERALAEAHERQERQRAEAALMRSEARLQRLNELLKREVRARTRERDRIWEISPDLLLVSRASDGVPVLASQAWNRLLGWTETELLETSVRALVHPEDPNLADIAVGAAGPVKLENRVRSKSGAYRWFSWTVIPDDGLLYGVGHDISEEKQAAEELAAANRALTRQIEEREKVEDTLRQMQRLEAVGQLTSGVAHDFNNLLTVVLGNLTFLERDAGENGRLARRLSQMRSAAERGAQLTGQLLAFSRRTRLEPKPIDLNETVQGMRDLLMTTMGGTIRIETSLQEDLWLALVDPTQIELIILNLAINARDAMGEGGRLTVRTANATLGPATRPEEPGPGDYVALSVSDTGTGMADDVLARAFEPFFTTKPVGRGSGLGLAQVYGFAKQSGGGVSIRTEMNCGTTVSVYLPQARIAAAGAIAQRPPGLQAGETTYRTVLVVDDDPSVREVTAQFLKDLGYGVIEAGSGGAAIDLLERAADIDVLLVDYAMPGMNGAEVAKAAQTRRPGLPVLFITGYADLTALRDAGEERILQKPFYAEELAAKLGALLGDFPVAPGAKTAASR